MTTGDLPDLILVAAMIWLALRLILSRDLFRAAILFITLSLMMAVAWVRLKAPDIALAEAAIGAGITGVLLIDTLGHLKRNRRGQNIPGSEREEGAMDEGR